MKRFGIWLVACVAASTALALAVPLHPGDKVTITVYNHPEMLTNGQIDTRGNVIVPLAGTVKIGGLEPKDADLAIADRLRRYVRYPAVDVSVTTPNTTVYVAGGPGGVANYAAGMHLSALVNSLQLAPGVDMKRVTLVRDGTSLGTFDISGVARDDRGPLVEPGDTVALVDKPVQVEVHGDVKQPQSTFLYSGQTLGDAVSQTGGFNADAAQGIIELRRAGAAQVVTPSEVAQDGDVIDVAPAAHVAVAGEVSKPGDVAMMSGNSLVAAIYDAGGPLQNADFSHVRVMHDGVATVYDVAAVEKGDLTQDPQLHSGDEIFVPRGHRIDIGNVFSGLATLRYFWVP
jgi:polysaccharide biosynthesis/export protein